MIARIEYKDTVSDGMGHYILVENRPVRVYDMMEWLDFFSSGERVLGFSRVNGIRISTIFMGLDNSFGAAPEPLVFETMIMGGDNHGYIKRCATYDEAIVLHREIVEFVVKSLSMYSRILYELKLILKSFFSKESRDGEKEARRD